VLAEQVSPNTRQAIVPSIRTQLRNTLVLQLTRHRPAEVIEEQDHEAPVGMNTLDYTALARPLPFHDLGRIAWG